MNTVPETHSAIVYRRTYDLDSQWDGKVFKYRVSATVDLYTKAVTVDEVVDVSDPDPAGHARETPVKEPRKGFFVPQGILAHWKPEWRRWLEALLLEAEAKRVADEEAAAKARAEAEAARKKAEEDAAREAATAEALEDRLG